MIGNSVPLNLHNKVESPAAVPNRESLLNDYKLCWISRTVSNLVRKEVLSGKAKFGVGSAGKELLQVIYAKHFETGDFFSGYYRDQTFMLAKDLARPSDLFSSLYGDSENDLNSRGRQMNNHFATPFVRPDGSRVDLENRFNVSSAISPLAGHLPRALGFAIAIKMQKELVTDAYGGDKNSPVSYCTIGDASTSEGIFFETINAAGVLQVPLAIIVQDDGYGISVPTALQTTKGSISAALRGFQTDYRGKGLDIYEAKAWDVEGLQKTFEAGIQKIRKTQMPAIFHITECTQPNGHSTSGSHERYKSTERLTWEKERDCILAFGEWLVEEGISDRETLDRLKAEGIAEVKSHKKEAWIAYYRPIQEEIKAFKGLVESVVDAFPDSGVKNLLENLSALYVPVRSDLVKIADEMQMFMLGESHPSLDAIEQWRNEQVATIDQTFGTHLHSENPLSALAVEPVPIQYESEAPTVNGFEILNKNFDALLAKYPNLCAFGEDLGNIGDVNQGFAGLQEKYGEIRVFDTGIREWSIAGQAIGMAMQGLRPIAEIQYLDYIYYALPALTDDLACLRYRTAGSQSAPVIIRTRGHRLEGIWHSGSYIASLIHSLRGMYLCVPRNMTQAAGMYNTLLQSDDPAIVIEVLNGYRSKEALPTNLGEFTVPLGVPEILREGEDLTLVTYGACVRIAEEACDRLAKKGISVELIDVQTLLPFDLTQTILQSLKKTNRILFLDEDVPGGTTAYMMQEVLEHQGGYFYLDSQPKTLSAKASRPPYGNDGDYYNKPQVADVFWAVWELVEEAGGVF
ncbi:MAG: thiamine pyrophosphate-dependent enzyme [Bacteroidota bacterium]